MDDRSKISNEKNNEFLKEHLVTILSPFRNIVQDIRNMKEEIIIENGKTLISKKQAIEIALTVIPDLEDRYINSISLETPKITKMICGDIDDCWCINYSPVTKSSGQMVLCGDVAIFINKYTGKVMYNGALGGS
jgi:hypothetical protein